MLLQRFSPIRSILCLGCHADDIEIGCGGTMLKLLADYPDARVHWVVLSAEADRAQEVAAGAGRFLGGAAKNRVIVKSFRDTLFPHDGEAIKRTFGELREEVRPDVIFTHRREDLHQDHRLVADLTWCTFRDHLILEYEIPKYEGDLGHPNVYVTLDEELCRRKIKALMDVFSTQRSKRWFTEDTFWALLRLRGLECNSPSRFAEGLYCRKLVF